jgi:hypothetical protein
MRDFLYEEFDETKKTMIDIVPEHEDEILLKIYDWTAMGRIILPSHIGGIKKLQYLHRRKYITWDAPIMELTDKGLKRMWTERFRRLLGVERVQQEGIRLHMCVYHNPNATTKHLAKELDELPESMAQLLRYSDHIIVHNTKPKTYSLSEHALKVCKDFDEFIIYTEEREKEFKKRETQDDFKPMWK